MLKEELKEKSFLMILLHDKQSDKQLHGYLAYAQLSQVQRAEQANSEWRLQCVDKQEGTRLIWVVQENKVGRISNSRPCKQARCKNTLSSSMVKSSSKRHLLYFWEKKNMVWRRRKEKRSQTHEDLL